jgi:hypothetical protein
MSGRPHIRPFSVPRGAILAHRNLAENTVKVKGRAWLPCWLAGMLASGAFGAATDYIGAAACGNCHPAQFAGQSKSGHSLALRRAPDHPLAKAYMASPDWKRGTTYQFVFSRRSDGFFVQSLDYATRQNMDLPVEWAFGAGIMPSRL